MSLIAKCARGGCDECEEVLPGALQLLLPCTGADAHEGALVGFLGIFGAVESPNESSVAQSAVSGRERFGNWS